MVDLTFKSRTSHFIPLALLRKIAEMSPSQIPEEISYLDEVDVRGIQGMDIVTIFVQASVTSMLQVWTWLLADD